MTAEVALLLTSMAAIIVVGVLLATWILDLSVEIAAEVPRRHRMTGGVEGLMPEATVLHLLLHPAVMALEPVHTSEALRGTRLSFKL